MTGLEQALSAIDSSARRRFDDELGRLVGSRCPGCGVVAWPSRAVCHACGLAGVVEHVLPKEGTLTTCSEVWVPVEGVDAPYVVGLVAFETTQVFGHVRGLPAGARMPIAVQTATGPGESPCFWFEVLL